MCSGWDSRTLACVDSVSYHKSGSNRPCMHFPTSSARVCMYTCLSVEEIAANGWLPWKMLQNGIWEAVWKCFTVVSGCSSAWCWKGRRVLSCIVEGRGEMCCRKTLPHPSIIRDRASFPNGWKCYTAPVRGLLQISTVVHHADISDMSAPLLWRCCRSKEWLFIHLQRGE